MNHPQDHPMFVFAGSTPDDITEGGFKDGRGTEALFAFPNAISSDTEGNIYVADTGNNRIRLIRPDEVVSTYAGNGQRAHQDGDRLASRFSFPCGVIVAESGNMYVSDGYRVRKLSRSGFVSTLAIFEDDKKQGKVPHLVGIGVDGKENVYVVDRMFNQIFKIDVNGNPSLIARTEHMPHGLLVADDGLLYVNEKERILTIGEDGVPRVYVTDPQDDYAPGISDLMGGMAFDRNGNLLVADEYCGVRRIDCQSKRIEAIPGIDSDASSLCFGANGDLFISSGMRHLIYRLPSSVLYRR